MTGKVPKEAGWYWVSLFPKRGGVAIARISSGLPSGYRRIRIGEGCWSVEELLREYPTVIFYTRIAEPRIVIGKFVDPSAVTTGEAMKASEIDTMPAGLAIDTEVAKAMRWTEVHFAHPRGFYGYRPPGGMLSEFPEPIPAYSTDPVAMMQVLEWLRKETNGAITVEPHPPDQWLCIIDYDEPEDQPMGCAAQLPLAVCRAALKYATSKGCP